MYPPTIKTALIYDVPDSMLSSDTKEFYHRQVLCLGPYHFTGKKKEKWIKKRYGEKVLQFAKGGKKSEIWDEIAEALRNDQFCRDAQQCWDKWEKLAAAYKGVRDGAKDRDDNPFFEEMHPLLSGKVLSRKDKERDRDQEAAELSKMTVVCNETARRDYEVDHNDAAKRNYDYYRDEEQWSPDGVP